MDRWNTWYRRIVSCMSRYVWKPLRKHCHASKQEIIIYALPLLPELWKEVKLKHHSWNFFVVLHANILYLLPAYTSIHAKPNNIGKAAHQYELMVKNTELYISYNEDCKVFLILCIYECFSQILIIWWLEMLCEVYRLSLLLILKKTLLCKSKMLDDNHERVKYCLEREWLSSLTTLASSNDSQV